LNCGRIKRVSGSFSIGYNTRINAIKNKQNKMENILINIIIVLFLVYFLDQKH
jgi:hypothetical protein